MSDASNGHVAGGSPTARQVHDDVEGALRRRPSASPAANRLRRASAIVWRATKRHPFAASALLGAGGMAAAAAVGVAELSFAAALAFAAYKVLREGEPPLEAVAEIERELPA